jgi:electron transfer flavoprotein beta subunit
VKIIVCVKQVAHIYVQNGYDANTQDIVTQGLVHMINPYDEVAVEEGIRLKEKSGGKVTAITLGPEKSESALRWCLAMGADKAVHVVEETGENIDPWRTASVLADVIKQNEADLLLFGKKAIDDEMGQVGYFVAELLDLPVVSAVVKIVSVDKGNAVVWRALERGNREEVICPVPAVLTVDKSLNHPRYPTFPARKTAQTKPVEKIVWPSETTAFKDVKIKTVRLAPPKLRPKKILSPDSSLSAAARINFVMTGGMGQKKGAALGGDIGQIVSGIIEFLKEKKFIGS